MQFLSHIIKLLAKQVLTKQYKLHKNAIYKQNKLLISLLEQAKNTDFGKTYNFNLIKDYETFKENVAVNEYENLLPFIEKIKKGKENVLWKGKPIYFAKTSGTTSGTKYIPITKESIGSHIKAARNSLFAYVKETNDASFFTKKMIFIQGSPKLKNENGILTGRLSGIVYHHVPKWLIKNRKPSYDTNCIENWEEKINAIVSETLNEDMSVLSGIPPWCIMYFEELLKKSGKQNLKELYPSLKLYVHGGVNFKPYEKRIKELTGNNLDFIETFPASEGFFAYQDAQKKEGLLLNLDGDIFYEFIETSSFYSNKQKRIFIQDVELNKDYVLVVSTNAGLWSYNTGDTIKFVSLNPYRIVVTGRLKHFISAFGEHVIQKEVETAIEQLANSFNLKIIEFTVAPFVASGNEKSYHEWFIEFKETPNNLDELSSFLDTKIQEQNIYYKDLRKNNLLHKAKITLIQNGGFEKYFKMKGKLGGQNKIQHLANNRELATALQQYVKKG